MAGSFIAALQNTGCASRASKVSVIHIPRHMLPFRTTNRAIRTVGGERRAGRIQTSVIRDCNLTGFSSHHPRQRRFLNTGSSDHYRAAPCLTAVPRYRQVWQSIRSCDPCRIKSTGFIDCNTIEPVSDKFDIRNFHRLPRLAFILANRNVRSIARRGSEVDRSVLTDYATPGKSCAIIVRPLDRRKIGRKRYIYYRSPRESTIVGSLATQWLMPAAVINDIGIRLHLIPRHGSWWPGKNLYAV